MHTLPPTGRWAVSIVSHGHGDGVSRILKDVAEQLPGENCQFVLTLNVGESTDFIRGMSPEVTDRLRIIRNENPQGFSRNHNQALADVDADFFLIADPDLGLPMPIFATLEQTLKDPSVGIVAPIAQTPEGHIEDNGRCTPTPWSQFVRNVLMARRQRSPRYPERGLHDVDWVAGLCMAMRRETFVALGGFDPNFHLYCEDVDLCLRARQAGNKVMLHCGLRVEHDANRHTFRHLRHLLWHLHSLLRLWSSAVYRRDQALKSAGLRQPTMQSGR